MYIENKLPIENMYLYTDFLMKIHPFLADNSYQQACAEIRPIPRGWKNGENGIYVKSLNLWRLDEKGRDYLAKYLEKINGLSLCLYYSIYAIDRDKTNKKNGKANLDSAIFTQVLVIDFDNTSLDECLTEVDKLNNIGIETIDIFSGNGLQSVILLKDKCYNTHIIRDFTRLLIEKGFLYVDPKIVDASRVMRMPYTYNCKQEESKATLILNPKKEYERYDVKDVFEKIRTSFESVINLQDIEKAKNEVACSVEAEDNQIPVSAENLVSEGDIDDFSSIADMYKHIDYDSLELPIRIMLSQTPKGYRNSVLFFLVPFFKNGMGLSLLDIQQTMLTWNKFCLPSQEESLIKYDVFRLYNDDYKGTGSYTPELARKFGNLDFEVWKLKNKVAIPRLFFEYYNVLHITSIRIYLMMKCLSDSLDSPAWDMDSIIKHTKTSKSSVKRYIKQLIEYDFIRKKRSPKKKGKSYQYFINVYLEKSSDFIPIPRSTLTLMISDSNYELSNREIATYTYIFSKVHYTRNKKCILGQRRIGKETGVDFTRVSRITDELHRKNWIKKICFIQNNNLKKCHYILLF